MSANAQITSVLNEIGDIFTIKGDRFRSRAFLLAAQRVASLTEDIRNIWNRGELEAIPGVGKSIAAVIEEVLETGESKVLEELREELPPGVKEMLPLEGIGPKTAMRLYQELGITSIDDLEIAAKGGKIRNLKGFREKSEKNILESIDDYRSRQTRFLLGAVLPVIEQIIAFMSQSDAVIEVEVAGSARRRKETIGDLDVLVSSNNPTEVSSRFVSMPPVIRVLSQGTTRSTVVLENHLQVDLRVVPPCSYGAAIQYFTGSKEHNVKLRTIAVKMGYKLNEYGLFKRETDELVAGENEVSVYRAMGMEWMEPELRENRGEIEAAISGKLPQLVSKNQIRGDLHVHSNWSEGTSSIEEMVKKASELGFEYIAITDHSKSLGIAKGLDENRLRDQMKTIDTINDAQDDFIILKGIECEIKSDGSMDLSNNVLKDLDFVIGSIHSGFKSDEKKMTERVIAAIHNDYTNTIAHPTGRIIQKRRPYALKLDEVFKAAAEQRVMMEINAYPDRLDLNDINCRAAMEQGVIMTLGSDAHAPNQMEFLNLGVSVARRGWLEKKHVANTLTAEELINLRK